MPEQRLTERQALDLLFPDQVRLESQPGFNFAMRELRERDRRDGTDHGRQVQVALADYLDSIHKRRKRSISKTSRGLQIRVAGMPANPHLYRDLVAGREFLGIPEKQILEEPKGSDLDLYIENRLASAEQSVSELSEAEQVKFLEETRAELKMMPEKELISASARHLVGTWQTIYAAARAGETQNYPFLPFGLRESALRAAPAELTDASAPDWIRQDDLEGGDASSESPLRAITNRLIDRYRLPDHVYEPLLYYLLTLDPNHVTSLSPWHADVVEGAPVAGVKDAFDVIIRGVDEFVTNDDWLAIKKGAVDRRIRELRMEAGRDPDKGSGPNVDRLLECAPGYRQMVLENTTFPNALKKQLFEPARSDPEQARRDVEIIKDNFIPVVAVVEEDPSEQ